MKRALIIIGITLAGISLMGMIFFHEFAISEIGFLLGIIVVGIGYAKLPPTEKPAINSKQINENLQKFNDVLWGEEKNPPKEPEPQIKIIIVQKKEK
jgi:hypothetical protein